MGLPFIKNPMKILKLTLTLRWDSCIASTMKMKNCLQESCNLDSLFLLSSAQVMIYLYNSTI